VGGWGVGGWSEIEIKDNSAQLKLELGLSLAKLESLEANREKRWSKHWQ
jgi:hypothetical protein